MDSYSFGPPPESIQRQKTTVRDCLSWNVKGGSKDSYGTRSGVQSTNSSQMYDFDNQTHAYPNYTYTYINPLVSKARVGKATYRGSIPVDLNGGGSSSSSYGSSHSTKVNPQIQRYKGDSTYRTNEGDERRQQSYTTSSYITGGYAPAESGPGMMYRPEMTGEPAQENAYRQTETQYRVEERGGYEPERFQETMYSSQHGQTEFSHGDLPSVEPQHN